MSLIQPSDFWGKLEITGANENTGTIEKVQAYIDDYIPKYLCEVFGKGLADLLVNAMAVNEVVLTFNGDSAVITNYYAQYYSVFGNNPRIIVDQLLDNGNRKRRNDTGITKTVVNGLTTEIAFDFGVTGKYQVTLTKQLTDESSITFVSGTDNPLVIPNWEIYRSQFGDNPRADVYEISGTDKILRNEAGIYLIGNPLSEIQIDLGDSPQIEVILYGAPPVITDRLTTLLNNKDLIEGLKRYVYYYWHRDNVSFSTPMGQKKGQSQNSVDASINQKLVDRWNEMVKYNWTLNINVDRSIYPEYHIWSFYGGTLYGNYGYGCWLPEVYKPINSLGI